MGAAKNSTAARGVRPRGRSLRACPAEPGMEFDPCACSTLACNLPTQGGAPHGRLSQIQPDASHVPQRAGVATAAAVGLTIIVRSARAKSDTLKIGQWTHFVPGVAPISLGTIGWKWMLDSLYSPVNWVLQPLHIVGKDTWPMWFGERDLAMASVIAVHVWRLLPFSTVIILAGLTSIPREVNEAAEVDGAGFWS